MEALSAGLKWRIERNFVDKIRDKVLESIEKSLSEAELCLALTQEGTPGRRYCEGKVDGIKESRLVALRSVSSFQYKYFGEWRASK